MLMLHNHDNRERDYSQTHAGLAALPAARVTRDLRTCRRVGLNPPLLLF